MRNFAGQHDLIFFFQQIRSIMKSEEIIINYRDLREITMISNI